MLLPMWKLRLRRETRPAHAPGCQSRNRSPSSPLEPQMVLFRQLATTATHVHDKREWILTCISDTALFVLSVCAWKGQKANPTFREVLRGCRQGCGRGPEGLGTGSGRRWAAGAGAVLLRWPVFCLFGGMGLRVLSRVLCAGGGGLTRWGEGRDRRGPGGHCWAVRSAHGPAHGCRTRALQGQSVSGGQACTGGHPGSPGAEAWQPHVMGREVASGPPRKCQRHTQ